MNYYVGEAAGIVYEYLDEQKEKEATLAKMQKDMSKSLDENFIKMGTGWLIHEGKADLSGKGARTKVRLIQ